MIASRGYDAANIDPSRISTFSTRSEDSQTPNFKRISRGTSGEKVAPDQHRYFWSANTQPRTRGQRNIHLLHAN
jgi:hypothetical protein